MRLIWVNDCPNMSLPPWPLGRRVLQRLARVLYHLLTYCSSNSAGVYRCGVPVWRVSKRKLYSGDTISLHGGQLRIINIWNIGNDYFLSFGEPSVCVLSYTIKKLIKQGCQGVYNIFKTWFSLNLLKFLWDIKND